MDFKKTVLILFGIFLVSHIFAQKAGSPFITYYSAEEYKGHAQIWSIAEDTRGFMYFGTTTGIVEYDGQSWRNISLPQASNVRSLHRSSKTDIIYVGGTNQIGYLSADSIGRTIYKSLLPLIDTTDNKFADVWEIQENDKGIFFRSNQRLFRYNENNQTFKAWQPKARFNPIAFIPGTGVVVRDGNDFFSLQNDDLTALPNPIEKYGTFIYKMFPYSKGVALCVAANALFLYDFNAPEGTEPFTNFETEVDHKFKNNHLYMGCMIGDSAYAVTSLTGGIFIINKKGELLEAIDKDNGLKYDHVWTAFLASDNSLWLGMDKGISRVDYTAPVRFWNSSTGLDDGLNSVFVYKNTLYIAGMTGVYRVDNEGDGVLQKLPGLNYNTWHFNLLRETQKNAEKLLLSSSKGIYSIDGDKLELLSDISYNYTTLRSKENPEIIYANSLNSVFAYQFQNEDFVTVDTLIINGLAIRSLEFENELWISTFFDGVYRVQTEAMSKNIFKQETLQKYDTLKGFPDNLQLKPYLIDKQVYFTTTKGLYRYDAKADSIVPAVDFGELLSSPALGIGHFHQHKDRYLFATGRGIKEFRKIDGAYVPADTMKYKVLQNKSINFVYADSASNVYASGLSGVFKFSGHDKKNYNKKFNSYIRKVLIGNDSVIFMGTYTDNNGNILLKQPEHFVPTFEYEHNNIYFEYASPEFHANESLLYSFKLEGFDEDWSTWSTEDKNRYTNLREGNYSFMVKARNLYGKESSPAEYKFKILPPLYRTIPAYIVYFLFGGGLIFLIIKLYTYRLKQQNIRLEEIVKARTAKINQQKEEIMAQNDSLNQKNEEILTQNEVLNQQKEEILTQSEELEAINKELEKLSIVASETDNAILIMDENTNFEWCNEGFSKLYGYSFAEFKNQHKNLLEASSESKIKEIIEQCISTKQSIIYESCTQAQNGKKIWVQTTLSPITDFKGEVYKLIAIDSDIRKLKKYEYRITQKNKQITDSISAAKIIQNAILPSRNVLDDNFDNFILYMPKDIVSGDFYWFTKTDKYKFIAAIDCTGHGIPGAFMSMIGNTLLNQIVNENKIYDTAEIMTKLHESVVNALRQENSTNSEGMDVCLCRIEQKKNKALINFTGSKRPLFIYEQDRKKLSRLTGDRKSIGGVINKTIKIQFTKTEIVSENKNCILYLTSDGLIDQNNVERKRYGTKRFSEFVIENAQKPMQTQDSILTSKLNDWMQDTQQRDDITVVAVRV